MKTEFTPAETSALTGIDTATLRTWMSGGLVKPCRHGAATGKGRKIYLDARAVFVAAMVATLTRRGLTLTYVKRIAKFLNSLSIEEIEAAADGDKILASAGDAVPPRLMDREGSVVNRSGCSELLVCISMRDAWQRFEQGMAHIERFLAASLN